MFLPLDKFLEYLIEPAYMSSFVSKLYYPLYYYTGVFRALQPTAPVVFGDVDHPLAPRIFFFFGNSFKQLCHVVGILPLFSRLK